MSKMEERDLGFFSTNEIAIELRRRMTERNWSSLSNEVYNLLTSISVIPCVDAFPARWRRGRIPEIGLIRRNTGQYQGKWWCVGGRLNLGESFSQALKRHIREVLGVDFSLAPGLSWNNPAYVGQYAPVSILLAQGEYAGHEPSKYCTSNTYLVGLHSEEFVFGATAHGGQEASEFRWFAVNDLPPKREIAYGGEETLQACRRFALSNLL